MKLREDARLPLTEGDVQRLEISPQIAAALIFEPRDGRVKRVAFNIRSSLCQLRHAGVELIVPAALCEQFVVVTALDDAPGLDDHDGVGVAHR